MIHKYRPDIDGLRAVAVLAVLVFHGFPRWMPGGFVGVDIFFVISGYLISGVIFSDLQGDRFSYRSFYARRIRRIFPALTLVLCSSYAFGWLTLLPAEFSSLGKHVASGAGFLSNVTLWTESGYFDRGAEVKPLLHLWSLGVEEQFYIVWPIVLSLLWKSPRRLTVALVSMFVVSFVLNVVFASRSPDATFYLPMTRFWELLVGVALALGDIRTADPATLRRGWRTVFSVKPTGQALAWVGLILIAAALVFIDRHRTFPGWWAVLPTLGAGLLIAAGPDAWLNRRILGSRVFVAVGLISYPLYLWHWPLLVFGRIIHGETLPPATVLALLTVAIVLASLTYFVIERPIRFGPRRPAAIVTLALLMLAVGMAGVGAARDDVPARSTHGALERIWEATEDWAPYSTFHSVLIGTHPMYVAGNVERTHVFFFGDSNMEQFAPRIGKLIQDDPTHYKTAYFATNNGCPPIPNVRERNRPRCPEYVAEAIEHAKSSRVDRVVVAACWYCYFVIEGGPDSRFYYYYDKDGERSPLRNGVDGDERTLTALREMLTTLSALKETFFVLNVPVGDAVDPIHMIGRDVFGGPFTIDTTGLNKEVLLRSYGPLRQRLAAIGKNAGARVIDPMDFLCGDAVCRSVTDDGRPIYKDAAHLRTSFVRDDVSFLDETVRDE